MSTNVNPYLIRCPECKTRNRIPAAKFGGTARFTEPLGRLCSSITVN